MDIKKKFDLGGKVAIVTGASKGIGKSMVEGLAQAGAKVVVSSRKQDAVDEVAKELTSAGLEAVGIACNAGSMEDCKNLIEKTVDIYGGVDILVNNAAANPAFGPVVKTEEGAFDKIIDVNLKGPFELVNLAFPIMKSRGGGSIINIASVGGISPEAFIGIYNVSKAALISLTKVQAKEMGRFGIRSNAICPGLIKTKFSEALWTNEELLNESLKLIPLARIGESDEMAGLAVFLASDASSYCTGGVFTADGGWTI